MKKKPKKPFEPDPDLGQPCRICGSIFQYRITMSCPQCRKKLVLHCSSAAEAMLGEDAVANDPDLFKHKTGCMSTKVRSRRWRTHEHHHVSYKNDQTVLLCYLCHQRMHGNAAITHHPFKKIYGKDEEPFVFAACVTALYIESLPDIYALGVVEDVAKRPAKVIPAKEERTH